MFIQRAILLYFYQLAMIIMFIESILCLKKCFTCIISFKFLNNLAIGIFISVLHIKRLSHRRLAISFIAVVKTGSQVCGSRIQIEHSKDDLCLFFDVLGPLLERFKVKCLWNHGKAYLLTCLVLRRLEGQHYLWRTFMQLLHQDCLFYCSQGTSHDSWTYYMAVQSS